MRAAVGLLQAPPPPHQLHSLLPMCTILPGPVSYTHLLCPVLPTHAHTTHIPYIYYITFATVGNTVLNENIIFVSDVLPFPFTLRYIYLSLSLFLRKTPVINFFLLKDIFVILILAFTFSDTINFICILSKYCI